MACVWLVSERLKKQWCTAAVCSTKTRALAEMHRRAHTDQVELTPGGEDIWTMGETLMLERWEVER